MRVCQFRHDGKWTSTVAAATLPDQKDLRFYSTGTAPAVKHPDCEAEPCATGCVFAAQYSSEVITQPSRSQPWWLGVPPVRFCRGGGFPLVRKRASAVQASGSR